MAHTPDPHFGSLLKTADERHGCLHEFANVHQEIWELVESHILAARAICQACLNYSGAGEHTHWYNILLFSCYEYLEDSVYLLIAHRQDAAYALLRNAAETARTAARISESDDNFRRWLNHKTGKDDVLPKPTFKFNDDDIGEKIVHQIYTACSKYGTHNHFTSMFYKSEETSTPDGKFRIFGSTDLDTLKGLQLWFPAVLPILLMASKGFQSHFKNNRDMKYKQAFDLVIELSSAVTAIETYVNQLDARQTSS